jgi:hypothetical protein
MPLQRLMQRTQFLQRALLVAGLVLPTSLAFAGGPFAPYAGSWIGSGSITATDGTSERIRCKAHYYVAQSDRDLNQELRCASDSYHFDVSSALLDDGSGQISGTWSEKNRNANGHVTGQAAGDTVKAHVAGTGFTAELTVSTRGDRQSVRIVPTGADITSVAIEMRRQ